MEKDHQERYSKFASSNNVADDGEKVVSVCFKVREALYGDFKNHCKDIDLDVGVAMQHLIALCMEAVEANKKQDLKADLDINSNYFTC